MFGFLVDLLSVAVYLASRHSQNNIQVGAGVQAKTVFGLYLIIC
jgi:hypothetical protein